MSVGREKIVQDPAPASDFVARIASGDPEAEREFVRKFQVGIRALVRRRCRPGDPIVDDLVQDVLERVLERLRAGAIRNASSLPSYVQSSVVHATNSEYRKRPLGADQGVLESIPDNTTPAEHAVSSQLSSMLHLVLADLPVLRDREILRRFYLKEQDKEEVCRDLGIDASHFHRVLFRARERCRELLERAGISES